MNAKYLIASLIFLLSALLGHTQSVSSISGSVTDRTGNAIPWATVTIPILHIGTTADSTGLFLLPGVPAGNWELEVKYVGYQPYTVRVRTDGAEPAHKDVVLSDAGTSLAEVVVSGTTKEVSKQIGRAHV